MEHKKVLSLVMIVMAYGLAAATLTASQQLPPTCYGYEKFINKCTFYWDDRNFELLLPYTVCCYFAKDAFQKAMAFKSGIESSDPVCHSSAETVPIERKGAKAKTIEFETSNRNTTNEDPRNAHIK
ncbi:hypothetical protein E2542_SST13614 [Spatholobus suberectus]|nr:hypothetical protein E2542_SST13614 [Spatholobus suberectus]